MKIQIDLHGRAMALKRSLSRATKSAELHVQPRSLSGRLGALLHAREEGSALVEIALVLPILMTLVTGLAAFGVAFNNQLTLTNAVGAGGQYLQLIRTTTTDPCKDTLTAIENAAPNLTPGSITLSFSFNGTAASGSTCSGDQSYLVQGAPVTVTAKYPCALPIYGTAFATGCQLSAKVTEYEY